MISGPSARGICIKNACISSIDAIKCLITYLQFFQILEVKDPIIKMRVKAG